RDGFTDRNARSRRCAFRQRSACGVGARRLRHVARCRRRSRNATRSARAQPARARLARGRHGFAGSRGDAGRRMHARRAQRAARLRHALVRPGRVTAARGNGIPYAPRAIARGGPVRTAASERLSTRPQRIRGRAPARHVDRRDGSGVRARRPFPPDRLQDQPVARLRRRRAARRDRSARLRPAIPLVRAGAAPLVARAVALLRLRNAYGRRVLPVRARPRRRARSASRPPAARFDRGDGHAVRWRNGSCRMSVNLQALARAGWLRRVDAALGEWIARAFPDSESDVALVAALAARAVDEGHSALRLDAAQDWLTGLDERGEAPALPAPGAWKAS